MSNQSSTIFRTDADCDLDKDDIHRFDSNMTMAGTVYDKAALLPRSVTRYVGLGQQEECLTKCTAYLPSLRFE